MNALGNRATSLLTGLATAIVIVTLALLPFLTPQWVAFEQGRSNATGWTGYSAEELGTATDSILADLVVGPPDFDIAVRAETVLDERERGHMRDVRTVFIGLWALAALSGVLLLIVSGGGDRVVMWRAIRRGSLGLSIGVVVLGAVALVAFDALFEAFHEVFFPAGTYSFDPATERLVQLFPFEFWQETAIVVGFAIIALCVVIAWVAGRRAAAVVARQSGSASSTAPVQQAGS